MSAGEPATFLVSPQLPLPVRSPVAPAAPALTLTPMSDTAAGSGERPPRGESRIRVRSGNRWTWAGGAPGVRPLTSSMP